jgi:rhodanese-related sulfurtransferase
MVITTTIDELDAARLRGCRIIDVREPHEYRAGHVPGAASLPVDRVPLHLAELGRRRPVYLVCESGNRSLQVARYLDSHGYQAHTVVGGTAAWRAAGRPVRRLVGA